MLKSKKYGFLLMPFILIFFIINQRWGGETEYKHFSGETSVLETLESDEIILLYLSKTKNRDSLELLLKAYDKGYKLAVEISNWDSPPSSFLKDKLPLAVVPSTCGPGCGKVGSKGIEITETIFDRIYKEFVVEGRHDHLFFYELGRNFWFYGEDSKGNDWEALHTGFAIFFRDLLIHELGFEVAAINGIQYEQYLNEKERKWKVFTTETATLKWKEKQLAKKKYFSHAPLFWSSMWWDMYEKKGLEGVKKVLVELRTHPIPSNEEAWTRFFSEPHFNSTLQ